MESFGLRCIPEDPIVPLVFENLEYTVKLGSGNEGARWQVSYRKALRRYRHFCACLASPQEELHHVSGTVQTTYRYRGSARQLCDVSFASEPTRMTYTLSALLVPHSKTQFSRGSGRIRQCL
jgi:hypothetical protein